MKNTKKTSNQMSSLAGKILQNPNSSVIQKSLAASALSQGNRSKETGGSLEEIASKVLGSSKYSKITKSLAGSVLSQSNKSR